MSTTRIILFSCLDARSALLSALSAMVHQAMIAPHVPWIATSTTVNVLEKFLMDTMLKTMRVINVTTSAANVKDLQKMIVCHVLVSL